MNRDMNRDMNNEPAERGRPNMADSTPPRSESDSPIRDSTRRAPERAQERAQEDEPSTSAQPASGEDEKTLDALFAPQLTKEYRSRWTDVQGGFVDDPRRAVQRGNELVEEVMRNLTDSFAAQRAQLEEQLHRTGEASTETLRITLRRYRSFFERLLSI